MNANQLMFRWHTPVNLQSQCKFTQMHRYNFFKMQPTDNSLTPWRCYNYHFKACWEPRWVGLFYTIKDYFFYLKAQNVLTILLCIICMQIHFIPVDTEAKKKNLNISRVTSNVFLIKTVFPLAIVSLLVIGMDWWSSHWQVVMVMI